jgi:ketosteroid isomerase-like protein
MSQENVKTIHRALHAFTRRDRTAWSELCDPGVEAIPVGDWPEKQIRGRDAVWDFLVATDEPWEPGPYEIVESISGEDAVVVRLRRDLRGKASGANVEYDYWAVFTFGGGKVRGVEWFDARSDALEAAGLSD